MKRTTFFLVLALSFCFLSVSGQEAAGLRVCDENPRYWEYHGKPVLLLGGSDEDNLFQMPGVEDQLNLLASMGGNYVRNTMSCRDSGNVWPFGLDPGTGLYDLNRWNDEYWNRFSNFLEQTHQRQIFVQVEVWATFDFYREYWDRNPFNPAMNVTYSSYRTKLPEKVETHPVYCDNSFFWSIPAHDNNMPVLEYQQRFVDKLLEYSLAYDHVFYCIDNETSVTSLWGKFWSGYIRKKAAEQGKTVHVTEMWDPWDLDHISHRESFDHPETYSFVEISQNNHQRGETHWTNGMRQIERLEKAGYLRPVHNVKTYGATGGRHGGGTHDGIEKVVRSTLFGSAAVRFHRPSSGLGLNDTAQRIIRGLRMATGEIDFFRAAPHNDLLKERTENEAYCRAIPGREYLVYIPIAGRVILELAPGGADPRVRRMELLEGEWTGVKTDRSGNGLLLESDARHTIYVIKTD